MPPYSFIDFDDEHIPHTTNDSRLAFCRPSLFADRTVSDLAIFHGGWFQLH